MKRKIGLIVALVFAVVGIAGLNSNDAGATGRNGNIYCTFDVSSSSSAALYEKGCAYVMTTYHKSELSSCGFGKASSDATQCESQIASHVSFKSQWAATNRSVITKMVRSYMESGDVVICHESNGSAQSACESSNKKYYDAGMKYPARCYVSDYEDEKQCGGSGSSNNNNNNNNNNNGGSGEMDTKVPGGDPDHCSTLFPDSWCNSDEGIQGVLRFIVAVLTGTVVIAGTVGIVICAVLILTARDNEQQLATGKKRLMQVVVGMIAWVMLAIIMNLLIPEPTTNVQVDTGVIKVESDEERTA